MQGSSLRLSAFLVASITLCSAACGGDDDGGMNVADPDAAVSDDGTPEVVSISPADGATGVIDEPIVIAFSEAMDRSTVDEQFSDATLVWNDEGDQVTITVDYPYADTAAAYSVVLPTTVTDVDGNALAEEFSATFALAPLRRVTIDIDADLTGSVLPGCPVSTRLGIGDVRNDQADCPNALRQGGLTFPLDELPAGATIYSALVGTEFIAVRGDPSTLGDYTVDHVSYATLADLEDPTVHGDPARVWFGGADIALGQPITHDVTDYLITSVAAQHATFQLRLTTGGDEDAENDTIFLRRLADEEDDLVDATVNDPNQNNRGRLVVEYFE